MPLSHTFTPLATVWGKGIRIRVWGKDIRQGHVARAWGKGWRRAYGKRVFGKGRRPECGDWTREREWSKGAKVWGMVMVQE